MSGMEQYLKKRNILIISLKVDFIKEGIQGAMELRNKGMTQEDKELLFNSLCVRLPYSVY